MLVGDMLDIPAHYPLSLAGTPRQRMSRYQHRARVVAFAMVATALLLHQLVRRQVTVPRRTVADSSARYVMHRRSGPLSAAPSPQDPAISAQHHRCWCCRLVSELYCSRCGLNPCSRWRLHSIGTKSGGDVYLDSGNSGYFGLYAS